MFEGFIGDGAYAATVDVAFAMGRDLVKDRLLLIDLSVFSVGHLLTSA